MENGNVLFIVFDQVTAAALNGPLADQTPTPNIDRFASRSAVFRNHYTVTVPCGPARASLLTGLYAMNHRSIRNGTPLARHHATVATEARKAGYEPLLFGYSDATIDPDGIDPEDPILTQYEGVAPGYREVVELRTDEGFEWPAYLRGKGYNFEMEPRKPIPPFYGPRAGENPGPRAPTLFAAEDSDTAYLTDRTIEGLDVRRGKPWFAHLTYIRPHPPLIAPEPYNTLIDADALPGPSPDRLSHPFLDAWHSAPANRGLYWGFDGDFSKLDDAKHRELRAVYLGLLAEVDIHIGRLLDWLDNTGQADDTLVILTSDHGEMLGEQGIWGKDCVFENAYHVPLMIRDPRQSGGGQVITKLTESVDVTPTILDWIGAKSPPAMDGRSLLPFVAGAAPENWKDAVFMEADFGHPTRPTRFQSHLGLPTNRCNVSILREERWKYVHFGGGIVPMLFDLENDPRETQSLASDPAYTSEMSRLARKMIDRMTERRDRRLTGYSFGV